MSFATPAEYLSIAASWKVEHVVNTAAEPLSAPYPVSAEKTVSLTSHTAARKQILSWPEYCATPLSRNRELEDLCGVASVHLKDESLRFGVGSFKVLGGALAVEDLASSTKNDAVVTVSTASAGNHGLGVAWGAQRCGAKSVIFLHAGVSEQIADKMRSLGAKICRVPGNYECSIKQCLKDSKSNGWHVVQDVAWSGYEDIPARISAGYSVCASEILEQLTLANEEWPTHVFVNAGVGGFASAIFGYLHAFYSKKEKPRPRLITVEPAEANVCLRSLQVGSMIVCPPSSTDCAEVSPLAWRVLKPCATDSVSVTDETVGSSMRFLASNKYPIAAGESGVAGLAVLLAIAAQPSLKQDLGINCSSRIACIICEAPPNEEAYIKIVGHRPVDVRNGCCRSQK
eukprot:GSMAST32.ASY1.ANO1.396.1 assembled CDS